MAFNNNMEQSSK